MTLNELMFRHNFITKIVFKDEKNELSKDLKVKIMVMRVNMGKIRKTFEDESKEVAEGLLPDGYRDLSQKQDKTDEEQKLFDSQTKEVNSAFQKYLEDKGKEEVTGKHIDDTFTLDEYEEIVGTNGSKDVEINGNKLSGPDFLEVIYTAFVEE